MVASDRGVVWLLLAYRIPREPSTPRIAVWRRLRYLGVAQLGDGLVALPADARTQEQLEWVAEQVAEAGGTSTLWRAELNSRVQERGLVEELCRARAAEYGAFVERVSAPGATTPRALRALRKELRQIERRDYFPPAEQEHARAVLRAVTSQVNDESEVAR